MLEAVAARFASGDRLRFLGMIGSKTKQALLWKHLVSRASATTSIR